MATVWVGQPSTATGAPSGGAPAPRCTPVVAGQAGAPPPSVELAREA
jgi:hypothetical protein